MANVSLPMIPFQDLYYYTKLTVSVFGVHNLKDRTMVCYVYHEGAGQNKNHAIVRFIMALVEVSKFDSVELFYPIRGHSFMPCHRDFSLIKRAKKN